MYSLSLQVIIGPFNTIVEISHVLTIEACYKWNHLECFHEGELLIFVYMARSQFGSDFKCCLLSNSGIQNGIGAPYFLFAKFLEWYMSLSIMIVHIEDGMGC